MWYVASILNQETICLHDVTWAILNIKTTVKCASVVSIKIFLNGLWIAMRACVWGVAGLAPLFCTICSFLWSKCIFWIVAIIVCGQPHCDRKKRHRQFYKTDSVINHDTRVTFPTCVCFLSFFLCILVMGFGWSLQGGKRSLAVATLCDWL